MSDLTALYQLVGEVNGKLDTLVDRSKARDAADEKRDERLRKVENRQHWYAGAVAVAVLFVKDFIPKWHT